MRTADEIYNHYEYLSRVETDGIPNRKEAIIRAMKEYAREVINEIVQNNDKYMEAVQDGHDEYPSVLINEEAIEELKNNLK